MEPPASRVRELALTLKLTEPDRPLVNELRATIEQRFLGDVLAACDRAVHRRLGADALVFVRRGCACALVPCSSAWPVASAIWHGLRPTWGLPTRATFTGVSSV